MIKFVAIFLLLIAPFSVIFTQHAPYPSSDVIKSFQWDTASVVQYGQGSDQWPMTWALDGNVYAGWGDGWGWHKKPEDVKRSIGVTRIIGEQPPLDGVDLWGEGPGESFGKPEALIAVGDTLYMFWTNGDSKYAHDSYAATSTDNGQTWELKRERLFNFAPAGFRVRGICQFGKGYTGALDDYLYIYFGLNRHPDLYLARVKMHEIFDARAYEWFAFRKTDGTASWTINFNRKAVVFHDNNAYLWHISVSYFPDLERYIMTKPHLTEKDNRETVFAPETGISSLGIFDAPTPWGPWSTVFYEDDFLDKYVKFNYIIPAKFIDSSKLSFWLAWSGWPEYDNVSFIKCRFNIHK